MTAADYSRLYDEFQHTAFRLECRQDYGIHAEDPALRAFREGSPRPERSVRTSPWLSRIATDVISGGKDWSRVRLVEWPLTEYTRFALTAYVESQAAGEGVRVADSGLVAWDGPDFWLFDAGRPGSCAVELHYTDDGAVKDRVFVDDSSRLERLAGIRDAAVAASEPLNVFLAQEAAKQSA